MHFDRVSYEALPHGVVPRGECGGLKLEGLRFGDTPISRRRISFTSAQRRFPLQNIPAGNDPAEVRLEACVAPLPSPSSRLKQNRPRTSEKTTPVNARRPHIDRFSEILGPLATLLPDDSRAEATTGRFLMGRRDQSRRTRPRTIGRARDPHRGLPPLCGCVRCVPYPAPGRTPPGA